MRWSIGIHVGPSPLSLTAPAPDPNPVLEPHHVTDVPARFVADPFLLPGDDGWSLLFEVLNADRERGEIGLARSRDLVHWEYEGIVLRAAHHLSYPYVFRADGEILMVPESGADGSIGLWRATAGPHRWEQVSELLRGHDFADPSLARHGGRWWLWTTTGGTSPVLRLYGSAALDHGWEEHPASPVVSDTGVSTRSAGRVLTLDDRLLRFTQEATASYGERVWASEVVELSPGSYRERPVGDSPVLSPGRRAWNVERMHHLDAHRLADGGWVAAVDGHGWRGLPRIRRAASTPTRRPATDDRAATRPRIAVLATSHDRREVTLASLAALHDQEVDADLDVVLVDAGSSDGTAAAVRERFPSAHVDEAGPELYWNAGMRRAWELARQRDPVPDAYLWLNDDTILDRDAVARLLAVWRDAGEAIVAGATRDPDTGALTYGGVRREHAGRPLRFSRVEPGDAPVEVETINGNCVLVPATVAERVGNLDARFTHGMGDFDYGLRARCRGVTVLLAPGTVGTCAANPPSVRDAAAELRHLRSPKGLPPREWRAFARRWAGPLWPVYFVSPYLRRLGAALRHGGGS